MAIAAIVAAVTTIVLTTARFVGLCSKELASVTFDYKYEATSVESTGS